MSLKNKDTINSTHTENLGYFTVSGTPGDLFSKPELYIEVEYEYSGEYGQMDVQRELFGINRRERTSTMSYSSLIDFGNITFSSDHCRAYVMVYQAMEDFMRRTDKHLPYDRLKVVTRAPIHGGTPYSTTDKIRIPSGYNFNLVTAKHELAHTVRHSLDGSFAHFLHDVAKYVYTQKHTCGKYTNEGFAFNEGWAEFWAGSCYGTYGNSPANYSYEGNVAKGLRALKGRCGTPDGGMVTVLEKNKGSIHSYDEFASAHHSLYGCQ